jgi:hypothetical protein
MHLYLLLESPVYRALSSMKNYILIVFYLFFLSAGIFAQSGRTIRVKAGDDVAQAYSSHGFYRFPQFGKATLYYNNKARSEGQKFNYNVFSGNLQFVGPKGDTMDLGGQATIDSIVFENNVFLNKNGWMEVSTRADSVMLLKRTTIKTQVENVGAYGISSSTASIDNIKTYSNGAGVYNLVLNQDVVVIEVINWFFKDNNNNLLKANKANLLQLLSPSGQAKADAYLKQNKTSFEKEGDLKKLMAAIGN